MFRFLGRCNCCNPSIDILTAEDQQAFVACREERLDSNTVIHGSQNGTNHSKLVQSPQSNSQAAVEQNISVTLQDALHSRTSENAPTVSVNQQNVNSRGMEHIDPEFQSDRFTTQAAMFEKAHNFSIENAPITTIGYQHQHVNHHGNYGLNNLKEFVSFSAFHNSSAQDPERCCHPGTRKNVLIKMRTWMDDPNAPERILWLNGPVGVGKSAIAQTISSSYGRDKVGATFFFFRSDPSRNDGNRLFPTLAWQLALSVPNVKDLIAFSLQEDPDLPRKAVEAQFEQLIAQPFLTISDGGSAVSTSRVIVIDGLDECSDVKLQKKIFKTIGNAVADPFFPLRFIISSRSEAHIQDLFDQFLYPTLPIDLANVELEEEAFRDIQTFLASEFVRIAVNQELDPEGFPGQAIIDALISESSGQFLYTSAVIRYVDDEYGSAVENLGVILGLRPSAGQPPFSELDALYAEILQRQPDRNFLKQFLAVLVARNLLSEEDLHKEDAMLLGLDENELHRKLRGMRSVFKSKPFINVHHKSFLDFLHDSSRSGEYHIGKHFANRRYMELITDVLVKAASKVMKRANSHGSDHFQPIFATIIQQFPLKIELPLQELWEILQPLLVIQEKLLQLPDMSIPWIPRACDECWTFYMIDDLFLHLACFRGATLLQEPKHVGIHPLTEIEEKENIPQLDLDTCLSLLLAELRSVEPQLLLNMDTIGLVRALIRFDPTESAMKVRSIMDAQNLLELIFCLNKNQCFKSWFGAAASNATRLAAAIYGRVPLLPQSLFLNSADLDKDTYQGKPIKAWTSNGSVRQECYDAFMWGNLSHDNVGPFLGICSFQPDMVEVLSSPEDSTLRKWWQSTKPSVSKIQQIFLEVAKVIQYVHSLGIVFRSQFDVGDVYLDSDNHVKVQCLGFCPTDLCKGHFDYDSYDSNSTLEANIFSFGVFFYKVVFNKEGQPSMIRPREPEIPDNVWQLIQWCCAADPRKRPTMNQVVHEMESWSLLG